MNHFWVKKKERKKAEWWRIDAFELWLPDAKSWLIWKEKILESPLDCKEIKPVNPKGNQPQIFIGRTNVKAPIFLPPKAKSLLIGKDPDAGKDWRQEEKGMTKDEMVWWHHQFNGHEFAQTPGNSEWQGSLVCCISWGRKELDITEWLKNNNRTLQVNYTSIERTKKYDLPKMSYKYCY